MSSTSCSFVADTLIGPAVDPCRREFDFTLFFEQLVFQLLPSSIFVVIGSVRLITLLRRPPRVGLGLLHTIKLTTLTIFSALWLASLISISTQEENEQTRLSIPAVVLSLIAAIQLTVLSHAEHVRSYSPSFIITLYLSITLLLRICEARTYAAIYGAKSALFGISVAIIPVQLIIIVVEQLNKARWFKTLDNPRTISREESVGFWSQSSLAWLNRLLVTGYHRPLNSEGLQITDSAFNSSQVAEEFSALKNPDNYGPLGLLGATYRCLGHLGLMPALPRLCMTGFTFCQPFLAFSLISFLEDPSPQANNGYGLIGATILVYGGLAISQSFYAQLSWKCATKIRGGIVGTIHAKMLRLRYEDGVESKVLTLVINDAWKVVIGTAFWHDLWAAIIETSIGTWLLWRQVGPASLAVLGVVSLALVLTVVIGSRIGEQQSRWLAATESRLEITRSLLSSLKAVKMMAYGQRARSAIEKQRVLEFAASRTYRALLVGTVICSFTPLTLAPLAVLGAYVGSVSNQEVRNGAFDTAKVFSSLILIGLIANPLIHVFQIIPNIGTAVGCAKRVEEFLRKDESRDQRSNIEHWSDEPESKRGKAGADARSDVNQLTEPAEDNKFQDSKTPLLALQHVNLSRDGKTILKDVNLQVSQGQHIVITGPVGSGKSLLLQVILGEVVPDAGSIHIQAGIRVGYCSQTAWLENLGVGENAFRGVPEADEVWRERVVGACALRELISTDSERGKIGSSGSRISGGEKQRLSIARAIACRPSLLILDDVFSAIDRSTKDLILNQLFGENGIVTEQGIAVIQVTHDRTVANLADSTYQIDDNGHLTPYEFPKVQIGYDENTVQDTIRDSGIDDKPTGHHLNQEEERGTNEKQEASLLYTAEVTEEQKEHADPASVGDREVYRVYFGTIGPLHMGIFVLGLLGFAVTLKLPDVWVRWWAFDANQDHQTKSTAYWIGLYAFLGVLSLIVSLLSLGHLALMIIPSSGLGLHGKLIRTVTNATYAFVSGIDTGSIMNRFNQDLMLVDFKLPLDLFNTFSTACIVIVQIVLVALGAVYSLGVIPVLFAVLWVIQHFYLRTSKQLRQLDLETKAYLHTKISESYQGIITVRAHGWESRVQEEFWDKLDRTQDPQYLLWMVQTWLTFVLNMVVACLAAIVSAIAVSLPSKTSAGALGVAFVNMTTLGEFLTHVIQSWTSLETSLGAIARIEAFEKQTPIESESTDLADLPPGWPHEGSLSFDHVWTTYHPENEKPVWSLQDITLEVKAGERIAVCGRSGSGKSTLVLSLLGLIETPRGAIYLDGIDISRVPRELLRSKYFVISQESFLLGETIREILDPEGRFFDDDTAIESVLRECAMLNKVNECGGLSGLARKASFSVGEAQLLSLSRAILYASKTDGGVVLFDEATSSIDRAMEERIMRLIVEKLQGKTIISVLHRLEAALEYDKILILEDGRVLHFEPSADVVNKSELFSAFRRV